MLHDKPILSKHKPPPSPNILAPEDTPIRLQAFMDICRKAGQRSAEANWNMMCQLLHDKSPQLPGTDALSYMSTCLTYFNATWLILMKRMADDDEAGIETDEMIQAVLEGAQKLMKSVKINEG